MKAPKPGSSSNANDLVRPGRIKDEVYRWMFLLEERRAGSEMGLALVLLRAWQAAATTPASEEQREWLKKVSPICLEMIDKSLDGSSAASRRSTPQASRLQ